METTEKTFEYGGRRFVAVPADGSDKCAVCYFRRLQCVLNQDLVRSCQNDCYFVPVTDGDAPTPPPTTKTNDKFGFTGKYMVIPTFDGGRILWQIYALRDIGTEVPAGTVGGWIEKEANLSTIDESWIYDDAQVFDDALICDDARIKNNAQIYAEACIYGSATVLDEARVCGNAHIKGSAVVGDGALVHGCARVCDHAKIFGDAEIFGDATVGENACVQGSSRIGAPVGIGGRGAINGEIKILK